MQQDLNSSCCGSDSEKKVCTLEDVEGYVVQSLVFSVTSQGRAEHYIDACDYDPRDVDEYHCMNCDGIWTVKQKYDQAARVETWRKVVERFSASEVV